MIKLNEIAVWVSSFLFVVKVIYIKIIYLLNFKVKVHGKLEYVLINRQFFLIKFSTTLMSRVLMRVLSFNFKISMHRL